MKNKKLLKNKAAKGLALIAIIVLLSSILAGTLFYQSSITANAIKQSLPNPESKVVQIKEVNDIKELNQLNQGWYQIRKGYVFYLDSFNSYVPLWIKVNNLEQQDGIISVDADGNVKVEKIGAEKIQNDVRFIPKNNIEQITMLATVKTQPPTVPSAKKPPKPPEKTKAQIEYEEIKAGLTDKKGTDGTVGAGKSKKQPEEKSSYIFCDAGGNKCVIRDMDEETLNGVIALSNAEHDGIKPFTISNDEANTIKKNGGTISTTNLLRGTPIILTTEQKKGQIITTTEKSIDENGNIGSITTTKRDKDKPDNIIERVETTQTYKQDETTKKYTPLLTTVKTYNKKVGGNFISNSDYTEITTDSLTREPKSARVQIGAESYVVTYKEDGSVIVNGQPLKNLPPSIRNKLSDVTDEHKAWSTREFLTNVERVFTEFNGLGYYATLFFDQESLLAWRDNVDKVFATLYLGTEYWSSSLCSSYLDGEDVGVAYAETPQGLAQIGAHIEATRTMPVTNENGSAEFIYKITFNIRNGDYEKDPRAPANMSFNVVLTGERTVNLFNQDQSVARGSSYGRVGRDAIVQTSTFQYDKICIVFDEIPLRWKLDGKELCNTIQESSGEATTLASSSTSATASGINNI